MLKTFADVINKNLEERLIEVATPLALEKARELNPSLEDVCPINMGYIGYQILKNSDPSNPVYVVSFQYSNMKEAILKGGLHLRFSVEVYFNTLKELAKLLSEQLKYDK